MIICTTCYVAPLVGAWIEIDTPQTPSMPVNVAPLVGAWIEIGKKGRGRHYHKVAPLVGAWIEIVNKTMYHSHSACRSSCRSVD